MPRAYFEVIQTVNGQLMKWATRDVLAAMEVRDVQCTGFAPANPRVRPQFEGMPIFAGFIGPCWGGETADGFVIRYESIAAYAELSQ